MSDRHAWDAAAPAKISKRVVEGLSRIGEMRRERPRPDGQADWTFLAGDEDPAHAGQPDKLVATTLGVVATLDPSVAAKLHREPPCAYSRPHPEAKWRTVKRSFAGRTVPTVEEAWRWLEDWFTEFAPEIRWSLRPGATREAIKKAEAEIGAALPFDVVRSYLVHDGQTSGTPGCFFQERLLSLDELVAVWKELKKRDDAGEYKRKKAESRGGKLQRRIWWSTKWIPLTEGKDIYDPLVRASTMVDLAPGREGDVGQVLFWSPDAPQRECLAPSWTVALEQFLLDLEDGAIVWEKRGAVSALFSVEPPPPAEAARPGESDEDDDDERSEFDEDDDFAEEDDEEDADDDDDDGDEEDDAEDADAEDEDEADEETRRAKSAAPKANPAHGEPGHVHGPHCDHGREDRPYDTRFDPYFDRADAFVKELKWKEAIQEYTYILSEAPDDPDALALRAYCRLQIGKLTEAAIDASRAIELDPRLIDALLTRAEIMEKTGSEGDALVDYERMLELDPFDVTALARSIETLATSQDPSLRNGDLAIELSERLCVETKWKDPLGLVLLASSYAEADDFANAVKWAKKAVKYATPDVEADCKTRLASFQAEKPYRRTTLSVE